MHSCCNVIGWLVVWVNKQFNVVTNKAAYNKNFHDAHTPEDIWSKCKNISAKIFCLYFDISNNLLWFKTLKWAEKQGDGKPVPDYKWLIAFAQMQYLFKGFVWIQRDTLLLRTEKSGISCNRDILDCITLSAWGKDADEPIWRCSEERILK